MLKNYKFLASLCGTSSNPQKPDLNINIKKWARGDLNPRPPTGLEQNSIRIWPYKTGAPPD